VMAALALLVLALPATNGFVALQLAVASMAILLALLSHVSPAAMLLGTLVVVAVRLAVAGARARDSAAVRQGVAVLLVAAVAGAAAFGVYYVRFIPMARDAWHRPAETHDASPADAESPPIQRIEPHQTRFVAGRAAFLSRLAAVPRYAQRSYGLPLMILAAWGVVAAWRRRDRLRLTAVLTSWVAVCLGCFVLAMLTPIDLRYYLAAAPAIAVLAGAGAADLLRRPPIGRAVALLLGLWLLAQALVHDFSWLT